MVVVVVVVENSVHHFEWMQAPSGPLTKLGGQKHPATHFLKHAGKRFLQVASQDVPQKLKNSPGGHPGNNSCSTYTVCSITPNDQTRSNTKLILSGAGGWVINLISGAGVLSQSEI